MSKVIGLIAESVSSIPYNKILKSALKHKIYFIDPNDKKLCEINKQVLSELAKDEWKMNKYKILDNLCYFLDPRRVEHCNLVINVDNRANINYSKIDEQLKN